MERYLNENFGGVKPKYSSEEALQRWRDVCHLVKNPKRRLRFTANLSKRYEAAAMRPTNQINTLEYWKIPLEDIQLATNCFHDDNLIGRGGFGGVYKAELFHIDVRKYFVKNEAHDLSTIKRSLNKVAVKKLDSRYGQGKEQFLQEIKVLSRLQHQNLVSLLGFCDKDNEMILVYEYAPNGSLDKCINQRVYHHTWAQRLQICLDMAHGLNYLHDNGIIHRDIKSANILLGHNWKGMIGDFGLSRISKIADHEFTMTNVAGTAAYVDPNYARTGKLTKQSDIYSFGVVLLEVLCGRLAVLPKFGDDPEYLLHTFKRHFQQKTVQQIIDPYIVQEFEKGSIPDFLLNSISTFVDITYKCLYGNHAQNLTMTDVITQLKKAQTSHVMGVNSTGYFDPKKVLLGLFGLLKLMSPKSEFQF